MLVAVVDMFCNKRERVCYATNATLAEWMGMTVRNIQKMLARLKKMGFILEGPTMVTQWGPKVAIYPAYRMVPRPHEREFVPPMNGSSYPPRTGVHTSKYIEAKQSLTGKPSPAAAGSCPPQEPDTHQEEDVDFNPLNKLALSTPSKKTTPSPFDKEVANLLRKFASDNGWVISHQRKNWAESVRLLRQSTNGPDQDTIKEVVTGYIRAYKEGKTKFAIHHCGDLRNQWHHVVRIASKVPPASSARAYGLAKESATYTKWPKVVTMDDVAAFAQRLISFAEHTSDKLQKLKKKLEAQKVKSGSKEATTRHRMISVVGVAQTAGLGIGGPDGFAKRYLEKVLREVRGWKDWSGSFEPFAPSLGSKYVGVRKAVLEYGGEEVWTMLKEAMK